MDSNEMQRVNEKTGEGGSQKCSWSFLTFQHASILEMQQLVDFLIRPEGLEPSPPCLEGGFGPIEESECLQWLSVQVVVASLLRLVEPY